MKKLDERQYVIYRITKSAIKQDKKCFLKFVVRIPNYEYIKHTSKIKFLQR